jgi:hypothetical protein
MAKKPMRASTQKGDLSDPNKWQGIMLMDMCSKVFSSIMTTRTFQLLDKHGINSNLVAPPDLAAEMASSP